MDTAELAITECELDPWELAVLLDDAYPDAAPHRAVTYDHE